MIHSLPARLLSVGLAILLTPLSDIAQTPAAQATPSQQLGQPGGNLTIGVLMGDKAFNSTTRLQSVTPVVEVRDENDLPIEGATVVFTLPAKGPGGTFIGGTSSYTTRSDSHGQASALQIIPRGNGRFQIEVVATLGPRRGEASISQTNTSKSATAAQVSKPFYKKKWVWIAGGAGVAAVIVAVILLTGSSNKVTVTPGPPVFQ
jgi:hypothetical protein